MYADDTRWDVFLRELSQAPDRTSALEKAGLDSTEYLERCKADSGFVASVAECFDAGIDSLEDTAVRRAMIGTEEAVFWQGQVVGWKTVYSDRLLTFLLAGNRAKYRGEGEKSSRLSDEARRTIEDVFADATGEGGGEEEFGSLAEAVSQTIPTVPKKAPKVKKTPKAQRTLFEPLAEVEIPPRATARNSILDEIEVGMPEVGIEGAIGPSDLGEIGLEELNELVGAPPATSARLSTGLRREKSPASAPEVPSKPLKGRKK